MFLGVLRENFTVPGPFNSVCTHLNLHELEMLIFISPDLIDINIK